MSPPRRSPRPDHTARPTSRGTGAGAIHAAQILINANIIDLNGAVTVGQPNAWSVDLPAVLDGIHGRGPDDSTTNSAAIPSSHCRSRVASSGLHDHGEVRRGLQPDYSRQRQHLVRRRVVPWTAASSAPMRWATSTSTAVYGAVTINNETGIAVVVQNVSAGTNSLSSTVSSMVDIIDTNQPAASQHSLYVYQPGVGISTYKGRRTRPRQTSWRALARVHVRDLDELLAPRAASAFSGSSRPISPVTSISA